MSQTTQDKRGILLRNSAIPYFPSAYPNGDRPSGGGDTFMISGSGFGTKSSGVPLFDNWESSALGATGSTVGQLNIYASQEIVDYGMQIEVAIKPKLNAGAFLVSAPLLSNYRDAILCGAKAKLYKIPRKDWTDFKLAQYNEAIFIAESDSARANQARGFTRFPTDTKTPDKKRFFY